MSFAAIRRQTNPLYLNFHGVSVEVIDHNGKPWVTAKDAGVCLQYATPERAINKLYRRNEDRFKLVETTEIEIEIEAANPDYGGQFDHRSRQKTAIDNPDYGAQIGPRSLAKKHTRKVKMRIFSLRGLNRLAIYANTPVAWEFHDWILDLIEGKNSSAELRADHHRLATWFFESRPRWRRIHDLFLGHTYSFDEIARRVGITPSSVRRAVGLMHKRGLISDNDYRQCKESSRLMTGFWRERQLPLPLFQDLFPR